MDYRYIGTESEIGPRIRLDSLGQKIKLDEAAALDVMKGGCLLISEATYQSLGITPDEEKRYRYPATRFGAPPEFKAKLTRGVAAWQKHLDEAAMGIHPSVVAVPAAPAAPADVQPGPSIMPAHKETKS